MTLVSSVQRARVTKAIMKWDVGDTCCNSSVSAKFALPLNSRNDVMIEIFIVSFSESILKSQRGKNMGNYGKAKEYR